MPVTKELITAGLNMIIEDEYCVNQEDINQIEMQNIKKNFDRLFKQLSEKASVAEED